MAPHLFLLALRMNQVGIKGEAEWMGGVMV
jgi:hypothetical protein